MLHAYSRLRQSHVYGGFRPNVFRERPNLTHRSHARTKGASLLIRAREAREPMLGALGLTTLAGRLDRNEEMNPLATPANAVAAH